MPTSYPLELLCIHTCESGNAKDGFDLKTAFKSVLKNLANYRNVNATWNKYYDPEAFEDQTPNNSYG